MLKNNHITNARRYITRLETNLRNGKNPAGSITSLRRELDQLEEELDNRLKPSHIRLLDMPDVYKALRQMSWRDALVLASLEGLLGNAHSTIDELAEACGVLNLRVSQIHEKAIRTIDKLMGDNPHPWKQRALDLYERDKRHEERRKNRGQ